MIFKLLLKIKRSKFNITNKKYFIYLNYLLKLKILISYVIKKFKNNDVKFYKNSFENEDFEVSLSKDELNNSGNSSFLKIIEDNNLIKKKLNFLKHKFCMLQKHLNNFMDNYEQFIMDNVTIYLKKISVYLIFYYLRLFSNTPKSLLIASQKDKD